MIEMEESEDNMSADDTKEGRTPTSVKSKPKKRSLVERELETSLTAHFTSPMTKGEVSGTSRYGRALRLKIDSDFIDSDKVGPKPTKSPAIEKTPTAEKIPPKIQTSPVYKMHASNSPIKIENTKKTPIKMENIETHLDNQIENIYNENISLSRFGSSEKRKSSPGKAPKLYVRKDLIQKKEKEETVTLMKNMFSPRAGQRASNSHLSNVLERSSEKYSLNSSGKKSLSSDVYINNSSVVKTLDFDSNKKKTEKSRTSLSKSELFELEAKCQYQVGDLAWARMGTYPFWPCIVTREPTTGMFVRKKLFGRIERDIIHVTFFGDNGRRSWIVDTMLRKFLGQLEFEAAREHFSPTVKKRDPRLYAAFFVSEKKMPLWSISVEEAETLLREPKRLRIDIFNDMLAKSRSMKVAKSKSGKVARTNSDVSLSESLLDTLFSENNKKSQECDGSRSKTRKSLDVSEVVTACLDNMAAKTGMTKIQKQSHMDRWLQKAKSKTPEKSQVKLQVPPKKERVISSKKKRWETPSNVHVKKPYSLRKSNESRNLLSQDNEHDYSSSRNESDLEVSGITFGIITKVESFKDRPEEKEVKDDTPAKQDDKRNNTCESPTFTQDYDDLIFAHEIITEKACENSEVTLDSDVACSDSVKDINMSIDGEKSTPEAEEIVKEPLLESLQNNSNQHCIKVSNTDNVLNIEAADRKPVNDINMSTDDGTNLDKIKEIVNSSEPLENNSTKHFTDDNIMQNEAKPCSYLHMNGHSEDIKNDDAKASKNGAAGTATDKPWYNSNENVDYTSKMDTESPNILKESETDKSDSCTTSRCNGFEISLSVESIEHSDADTSIDNLSQSLEENDTNYDFVKPVSKSIRKRSLRLKNHSKLKTTKKSDDGFAKYVELRKDTIMDENPELSEEEITEYLRKTWQYQIGEPLYGTLQVESDNTQDGRRRIEDKKRDPIDIKDGKKIKNNSTKDKMSKINLQAENKEFSENLTDKSKGGSKKDDKPTATIDNENDNKIESNSLYDGRRKDKQSDTIDVKDGKKIVNDSTKGKTRTIHLQAEKKVCTENLTDNTEDSGKKEDKQTATRDNENDNKIESNNTNDGKRKDKQSDIIDVKGGKKIEHNSTKGKTRTIRLQVKKKVCTVNLTDISEDSGKKDDKPTATIDSKNVNKIENNNTQDAKRKDKLINTIDVKDDKKIEQSSTKGKITTIQLQAENKVCTVNLTDESEDNSKKDDKQTTTIHNKNDNIIENNNTDDKMSTINLQAVNKVCTVNINNISQDRKKRKEGKQRATIDIKDGKTIQNNCINDRLSTIHLPAEKKVCFVKLTDNTQNGRRKQEDKQKHTIDDKDYKNIENNSSNNISSKKFVKVEKKVCTVNLTDILRQNNISAAFITGEKTRVLPVIKLNDVNNPCGDQNKSVVSNTDNLLINDELINCEVSLRQDCNAPEFLERNSENMDVETQRDLSLKSDVLCGQNHSIISSKPEEPQDPGAESGNISPDQDKNNSGSISEPDFETSPSNNKESIVSSVVVKSDGKPCDQNNESNCLKIVELNSLNSELVMNPHKETSDNDTVSEPRSIDNENLSGNVGTIDSIPIIVAQTDNVPLASVVTENKVATIELTKKECTTEVVETELENMDIETCSVCPKTDKQSDQNDTINNAEIPDFNSTSVCVTPGQDKDNSALSELNVGMSLHHNYPDNDRLNDNVEAKDTTLIVATPNDDKSLKSITIESEQTPIELFDNMELDKSNISALESEDSTDQLEINNLSNECRTASNADNDLVKGDNDLTKKDVEVDSILKSIDNFVNGEESPVDTQDSDLENGKSRTTINDADKRIIPSEMAETETVISESQSVDNISSSNEKHSVFNNVTSATDQTTGELKSLTFEPDNNKVCKENQSSLEDENSEKACPQNEIPPTVNGYHSFDDCTPDVSDGEFNAETSSIHSEDSEPLSVVRSKLQTRNRQKLIKDRNNPEFLKYVEIRQDALMDEHPELNQDEITEYLYKAWLYEENTKSDYMKTDDIEQSGLVKGLNDDLRQKSIRNSFKKRKPKPISEDAISNSSDTSDSSVKRRLRQRSVQSPIVVLENLSKHNSPKRKLIDDNDDDKSVHSDIRETHIDITQQINSNKSAIEDFSQKDEQTNSSSLTNKKDDNDEHETQNDKVRNLEKTSTPNVSTGSESKKYFDIFKQNEKNNKNPEIKNELEAKVKEEFDPDTVSINSEDSEVSVSKRKQRKYADKQPTKDDPEFLKYVELRQDALMDEHPELSEEEIISYLFKTWLYEESIKSDIKKSDELEQANLVKGLNTETQQPKKVRKKIKVEKDTTIDDDIIQKEKPRRKSSHPYYVEEDLSDSEDIEMFDIFKSKTKTLTDGTNEIVDVNEGEEVVDPVELYFLELTKPKPNVFKGLLREKVCDICEKTSNLVKCKGCNSMFHVDCVKKETEVKVEAQVPMKGKKKRGRKPKNLDVSGSQSDEKCQELSEDNNQSIEEIVDLETYTVDAENFEALLEVKMKELISTEANYDTSFSDCGITWNGAVAGKCEIVDVKLQSKIDPDYSDFKCNNCQKHDIPVCFVCKSATSKTGVEYRQRCQTAHCYKYYHMECLDHWPQTQFHAKDLSKVGNKLNERFEEFMCPRHVCHTCVSDDPRGCKTRFSGDKLARCVRCPATYHTFSKCLPAGSQILTGSHIVCPRHYEHRPGKVPCHVNTGWCFICALGGSLICCEYCPTSFHAECLNIKPPEGGYMCEDCETGRLPLYGEMVWVKLGHYRWWPGLILHPSEIPENIMAVKHSQGEFVVRFFGQYDHYWVNRGRVFPFQEGDSGKISSTKSKIDAAFTMAMEHAQRACEIMKRAVLNEEEEADIAQSLLPPHYVKLKVNKPVGSVVSRRADVDESSLTQCDCNPKVDDPCGPYSHCLNRMLLTECGPSCRAGDRCNNRAFEKRLYPRLAPYKTPHRGWGLRTLEDIRAGQFVIEYVGELIDEEEFRRRMNRKHEIRDENFYFLTLDKERMIDAGPKGNLARFMNHCCEPNCETQKWTVLGDVRVGLFAINDIPANSELTFNYNLECAGIEKKRCLCGAKRCSGYMGAKPKQEEPKKTKRVYNKKRKPAEESPSTNKNKPKRPVGRPAKPKELTEIEKDLLIIKSATNGLSSDSECSGRLSSLDSDRNPKALKRKRVDFSTEDSTNTKKVKLDEEKATEVGD